MTTTQSRESQTQAQANGPATGVQQGTRRYIYCIVDCESPASLEQVGIEESADVFAVPHDGIAALVSVTAVEKLDITRGNAIAHQRVMEAAMQRGCTVLPVKFNTIAEDKRDKPATQRIIDHVLAGRRQEIQGLLTTMRPLVELGVKGLWTGMAAVFHGLVEASAEIQALRGKLLARGQRPSAANMAAQIKLGDMVKKALEAKKLEMEASLLRCLKPLIRDVRKNKTFGDPMFANLAILVDKSRQSEIEGVLSAFEAQQAGQIKLRCVGPLPPCNFLELVITWDD